MLFNKFLNVEILEKNVKNHGMYHLCNVNLQCRNI